MRWLNPLARPLFRKKAEAAAPPADRPASGIDYLLSQASRAQAPAAEPPAEAAPVTWQMLNDHADQAMQSGDWGEAEASWRAMRLAFPAVFHSYTSGAVALLNLGQHEKAQLLLAEAAERFPSERAIPLEAGRVAMAAADWIAAEAHWRRALTFDVRPWWVYTELAGALEHQDRLADADAVLLEAQTRSSEPDEITLYTYPARLAGKREQWSLAVERWTEARRRFPHVPELQDRLNEARMRLGEHDPVGFETIERDLAAKSAAHAETMRDLVLCFESLGGTGPDGGCEFGCVQRAHGAEPLGLFRWATVPVGSLIDCLDRRFAGLGERASMSVAPHEGQWEITDNAYGTKMHSFISCIEVQHESMMAQASRRMRFLAAKLIDDLTAPQKVFVLKSGWHPVTPTEIEALSRGIRSYGSGMLLCVCGTDADHPEGDVALQAPNVLVGYIDFSGQTSAARRRPAWESLCARVQDLLQSPGFAAMQADAEQFAGLRAVARTAEDQADWQAALPRWQQVRDTFPDHADGHEGVIRCLRRLDRAQDGALILMEALRQFGDHPGLLLELARYTRLVDWPEQALKLYADIRLRFPAIVAATIEAEAILRDVGRYGEAEALLADALRRFPNQPALLQRIAALTKVGAQQDDAPTIANTPDQF